jgi:hypothetical protein
MSVEGSEVMDNGGQGGGLYSDTEGMLEQQHMGGTLEQSTGMKPQQHQQHRLEVQTIARTISQAKEDEDEEMPTRRQDVGEILLEGTMQRQHPLTSRWQRRYFQLMRQQEPPTFPPSLPVFDRPTSTLHRRGLAGGAKERGGQLHMLICSDERGGSVKGRLLMEGVVVSKDPSAGMGDGGLLRANRVTLYLPAYELAKEQTSASGGKAGVVQEDAWRLACSSMELRNQWADHLAGAAEGRVGTDETDNPQRDESES